MRHTVFPFFMAVLLMGCLIGCDEDINERALPTFEPTSTDASGGTWRTLVLGSPADVNIAPATTTGSAEYLQEIAQIVLLQKSMADTDRVLIEQWKSNGVVRWNEKARALVAKYNQPAEPRPNGTSPTPIAADPNASRAYSYLSVAFYDALVACWYYKFQNNRPQPVVVSNLIQARESYQIDLPGYPSEDAVVAQVAYRLLKVLFPQDSAALLEMAKGQKRAKLLSGIASPSDIAAGESIANQVADKVLARFRTDGMAEAADSVKMWMLTAAQRDSLRPPPPPATGSPAFNAAQEEMRGYNSHPSPEQRRIATYWSDGIGTYTPAGHWNEIACNFINQQKLSELKTARALSLLNIALCDAGICCRDTASYKTLSHSTFSGAAASVLGYLFPQEVERFNAMATEAGLSRIYAGTHYRFDCEAGLQYGRNIGSFAVTLGKADGSE